MIWAEAARSSIRPFLSLHPVRKTPEHHKHCKQEENVGRDRRLVAADPAPGSEVMVNRLANILFIQCVRAHIVSSSETCKSGWLRAIFDPKLGAALKAMHERVENPWTVERWPRQDSCLAQPLR